jgi:O-antigen ligase
MLQNKIKISIIKNFLIGLLAFTMPINKNILPIIIVGILIFVIIELIQQRSLKNYYTSFFIFSISLYAIHLLGMLYTQNSKVGNFDLEQKLSLLLFPIVFCSESKITDESISEILNLYLLGNICAVIICIANACYQYSILANPDYFFYTQFSAILHPSYFSMYLNFGVIILLFYPKINLNNLAKYLVLLLFFVIIMLNASKAGIICLTLTVLLKFLTSIINHKKRLKTIGIAIALLSLPAIVIFISPKIRLRFSEMTNSLNSTDKELNSTSIRMAIWKHSLHIIKGNLLFGVGTGDVKNELSMQYRASNEKTLESRHLNAHNQFLQTAIALGIIGLGALLLILTCAAMWTFQTKQHEATLLILLITINFLFEAMLETQAGVVFISFFLFLYMTKARNELKLRDINLN